MASAIKKKNGWMVRFHGIASPREEIWLGGRVNKNFATDFADHVQHLVTRSLLGQEPARRTVDWLAELDSKWRKKLSQKGLWEFDERPSTALAKATIADLIDAYRTMKFDGYAARTKSNAELVFRNLLDFFGRSMAIEEVSEGDADDYRSWLLNRRVPKLGETSARKDCAVVSRMMRYACRKRWISFNPFEDVPKSNLSAELFYVSPKVSKKVLKELGGTEWPLLFALARWGGLRVPSDVQGLSWSGVDWRSRRMTIYAKKTKSWRIVPIFDELLPLLEARHQAATAGEGDELVIPMIEGKQGAAVRTPLLTAIEKAGEKQWPDLWVNLRKSRQNELERAFGVTLACAWMGNTERVATKHYLRATDVDFERAVGWTTG